MGDNGLRPGTSAVCADHDAAIANLEESRQIHGAHLRQLDDRVRAQDGVLGQVLAALGDARAASDKAREAAHLTLQRVQEMASEWRREHTVLAGRIAELETPELHPLPSFDDLATLEEDTKVNIRAGDPVWFARKLDAEREKRHAAEKELAAAQAQITTRTALSEHDELKRNARWKQTAWLVTKGAAVVLTLAGLAINAYLQERWHARDAAPATHEVTK